MPQHRLADTPLFPLFVVLQILPEAWPKVRRLTRQEPITSQSSEDIWPDLSKDDNHARMERLMRAIDETRAQQEPISRHIGNKGR